MNTPLPSRVSGSRALGLALLLLVGAGAAQAQYGKIRGTVTDAATGEPLPSVNVRIEGTSQGAATSFDGAYTIIGLRPDTYAVTFSFIGYRPVRVEGVRVSIDLTTDLDVELAEEVVEGEEVVVTAERALVQKDLTATTAYVSSEEIRALPVENFSEVVELQAGVVNGHFRGGRLGEVGYWVDGLPVSDVYDGGLALSIENDMVQEAQVVTGAFNAEYGQAMSGIVNVVTKDGSNRFEGNLMGFLGDYVTGEETLPTGASVFPELDDLSATAVQNLEGSLGGPILRDRLFFFTSGRYFKNDGWVYGRDLFRAGSLRRDGDPESATFQQLVRDSTVFGDSAAVSLNPFEKVSGQVKLTAQLGGGMRLAANAIASREELVPGDPFSLFYFPTGLLQGQRDAYSSYLKFTHSVSNRTFYEVGITNNYTTFDEALFEDPNDLRYRENDFFGFTQQQFTSNFLIGGTNNRRFERATNTWLAKADVTSQIGNANLVKFGVEGRLHSLRYTEGTVVVDDEDAVPREDQTLLQARGQRVLLNGAYDYGPTEFSAYLQDKIELGGLIINVGLRFDYFDSDGRVLRDPTDPNAVELGRRLVVRNADGLPIGADGNPILDEDGNPILDPRQDEDGRFQFYLDGDGNVTNYTPDEAFGRASPKWQLSPRLGVAFPITEGGVVHFSYGQFFQRPNFELLYRNPYFLLGNSGSGLQGLVGNADLEPEQTISGEIGVKQQLTASSAVELTAYYRDIRNLAGTAVEPITVRGSSVRYGQIQNSDFGFVRGIILRLDQRIGRSLFAGVDYTFQVARTNASDPNQSYEARAANAPLEQQILPANWDQRHTVTATLGYDNAALDAGFGLVFNYGTGEPYTPAFTSEISRDQVPGRVLLNSEVKPSTAVLNLTAHKNFRLVGDHSVQLFTKVDNVLDARNETGVFGETGRATYSLFQNRDADTFQGDPAFLSRFYTRPGFFTQPRRVVLGLRYGF